MTGVTKLCLLLMLIVVVTEVSPRPQFVSAINNLLNLFRPRRPTQTPRPQQRPAQQRPVQQRPAQQRPQRPAQQQLRQVQSFTRPVNQQTQGAIREIPAPSLGLTSAVVASTSSNAPVVSSNTATFSSSAPSSSSVLSESNRSPSLSSRAPTLTIQNTQSVSSSSQPSISSSSIVGSARPPSSLAITSSVSTVQTSSPILTSVSKNTNTQDQESQRSPSLFLAGTKSSNTQSLSSLSFTSADLLQPSAEPPSSSNALTFSSPPSPTSPLAKINSAPIELEINLPEISSAPSSSPSESNRSPSFSQSSPPFTVFNSQVSSSDTPSEIPSEASPISPSSFSAGTSSSPFVINLFGEEGTPAEDNNQISDVSLGTTSQPLSQLISTTPPIAPQTNGISSNSISNSNFNHQFNGRQYHLSWRVGQSDLSWSSARVYCRRLGLNMVSLDDPSTAEHFIRLVGAEDVPFMWAGARISRSKTSLFWENGRAQGITRGRHPWSLGGLRGPQPDGSGSEDCLAILNNVYNDGVKFHDVSCHHRKPTACEV